MHRTVLTLATALTAALVAVAAPPAAVATSGATIPDAAMLQAEDLRGSEPQPVTDDYWDRLRPPQPCATRPYPSTALRRTDRAIWAMVGLDERPTVVVEDVALYRGNGARQYFADLRRALNACGGDDADGARWRVLDRGIAGDQSVLLRHRVYVDYAETYKDTYILVARTGRVLVTVADAGWEEGDGHEALVRELSTVAVRRAAAAN